MKVKQMTVAATLMMAAFTVGAANPSIDFTVEATIPDNDFYVTAVNGWDTKTQKMSWNESKGALQDFSQQLQMKNVNGGIKAFLLNPPVLVSPSSTDEIKLNVDIAGKSLPLTPASAVTLYDDVQAAVEKTAALTVSQQDTSGRPVAGDYTAHVTMVFDTVAP